VFGDGATTVSYMSKPLGPYTPAVRAGDFIIVSGQIGAKDGALVAGGVAGQTAQALANLGERLAEMGAELTDVVKTTCFLIDMESFATFNAAYVGGLGNHRPARSTVAVRELPVGAAVEIEAMAYKPI
jgi:2-iminobutanoate/2-iminopropanoate deaminase